MSCQQVPTAPAFNPYPRSVQVGEFEVAIGGGIWVAIGDVSNRQRHQQPALYVRCSPHKACDATQIAHYIAASTEAVQSQYTCRHR